MDYRDPAKLETDLSSRPTSSLVLGLDLGTNTGYAYTFARPEMEPLDPASVYCGQWDLSAGPYDSGAIRFLRLRQFLTVMRPDCIFYEDPKFTPPADGPKAVAAIMARAATSMEFLGALRGTVAQYAEEAQVPCEAVPIGTIKRAATGSGSANKVDMIKAANKRFNLNLDPETYKSTGVDNVADALFVLSMGVSRYREALEVQ